MKTHTLLIWEDFPHDTRFFVIGPENEHLAAVVAAAGQHVDMTIEDDAAKALDIIITDGKLDSDEVEHDGTIEGFTFSRVIIAGTVS